MAKVTVRKDAHEVTPTQQIVKAAATSFVVVDAAGRTITYRKLTALDQYRLMRIVGADASKNEMFMGFSAIAYAISQIDDDRMSTPASQRELDAMVQLLGEDGLGAISQDIAKRAEDVQGMQEMVDAAKNSPGTPA